MEKQKIDKKTGVSIVIPVKNERDNVIPLVDRIHQIMDKQETKYEVIFVDDGSSDGTLDVIKSLSNDPVIKYLSFDKNYGQTSAFAAGFDYATYDIIVTMDGDLQSDPIDIPMLLSEMDNVDMVTVAIERLETLRRTSSKIANFVRNKFTGDNIIDVGCSLRAFKKSCLKDIKLYEGLHRFFPTLFKMEGYKVKQIGVHHHPRTMGKTKYNIKNRLFKGIRDLFAVRWMQRYHLKYKIRESSIKGDRNDR